MENYNQSNKPVQPQMQSGQYYASNGPQNSGAYGENQQTLQGKNGKKKEPLNNQSKEILFGLLGGFFLLGAIALLVLMFIF